MYVCTVGFSPEFVEHLTCSTNVAHLVRKLRSSNVKFTRRFPVPNPNCLFSEGNSFFLWFSYVGGFFFWFFFHIMNDIALGTIWSRS